MLTYSQRAQFGKRSNAELNELSREQKKKERDAKRENDEKLKTAQELARTIMGDVSDNDILAVADELRAKLNRASNLNTAKQLRKAVEAAIHCNPTHGLDLVETISARWKNEPTKSLMEIARDSRLCDEVSTNDYMLRKDTERFQEIFAHVEDREELIETAYTIGYDLAVSTIGKCFEMREKATTREIIGMLLVIQNEMEIAEATP